MMLKSIYAWKELRQKKRGEKKDEKKDEHSFLLI